MKILVIFCIALICGGFVIWKLSRKGIYRTHRHLQHCIRELLDRGHDGGFMVITHARSDLFVQLVKYEIRGKKGLQLSFPIAEWSKKYGPCIEKCCQQQGVSVTETQGSNGMRFLDMDFGDDVALAFSLVEHIFLGVFKVNESDGYRVYLEGAKA